MRRSHYVHVRKSLLDLLPESARAWRHRFLQSARRCVSCYLLCCDSVTSFDDVIVVSRVATCLSLAVSGFSVPWLSCLSVHALASGVRRTFMNVFANEYSKSVQQTVYRSGEEVIALFPDITQVNFFSTTIALSNWRPSLLCSIADHAEAAQHPFLSLQHRPLRPAERERGEPEISLHDPTLDREPVIELSRVACLWHARTGVFPV
jgi:hypothetical protein